MGENRELQAVRLQGFLKNVKEFSFHPVGNGKPLKNFKEVSDLARFAF